MNQEPPPETPPIAACQHTKLTQDPITGETCCASCGLVVAERPAIDDLGKMLSGRPSEKAVKQDRATYGLTGLPPSKQIEILKELRIDVSPQTQKILRKPGIRICRRCWTRKGEFKLLPNGSQRYCPTCDKERRKEYGKDKSRWTQRKRRTVESIQRDVDYIQRRTRELMEKLRYLDEINEEIGKIHLQNYFLTSEFLKEMNHRHAIKKRLEVEVLRIRNQLHRRILQLDQLSTTAGPTEAAA